MNSNNYEKEVNVNEDGVVTDAEEITNTHTEENEEREENVSRRIVLKERKFPLLCVVGAVLGAIAAVLRSMIVFGTYDNKIALYPNGPLNTAFWISTVVSLAVLFVMSLIVSRGNEKYRPDFEPMSVLFSQSLCAFSYAALAFVIILTSKSTERLYQVLDSLLIVLSLISAASFFMQAYSRKESVSADAQTILKSFAPICTLFIAFYMYFDKSSVIHNTNKQIATVAFVIALLFLLYSVKLYVSRVKLGIFAFLCSATVFASVAYAVPNIVWFFTKKSPLLINVFFDILALALGVYAACVLCAIKRAHDPQVPQLPQEKDSAENAADDKDSPEPSEEEAEETEPASSEEE